MGETLSVDDSDIRLYELLKNSSRFNESLAEAEHADAPQKLGSTIWLTK